MRPIPTYRQRRPVWLIASRAPMISQSRAAVLESCIDHPVLLQLKTPQLSFGRLTQRESPLSCLLPHYFLFDVAIRP